VGVGDVRPRAVQLPVDDFLGSPDDQADLLHRELAQLPVRQRGTLLEDAEGADHGPAPAIAFHPDREVEVRALGLGAPEVIRRDLDLPQGVLVDTDLIACALK
jgi:hypothetical protein